MATRIGRSPTRFGVSLMLGVWYVVCWQILVFCSAAGYTIPTCAQSIVGLAFARWIESESGCP